MSTNDETPAARHAELRRMQRELEAEFNRLYSRISNQWQLPLGSRSLARTVPSGHIFWTYSAILSSCAIIGLILTLMNVVPTLGIALLAGAIFAGGSFVSQVWSLTVQQEKKAFEFVYGDDLKSYMQHLDNQLFELKKALAEDDSDPPSVGEIKN